MAATFLKLRTVIYAAPDLPAAKAWYAALLEQQPYFDAPFYVGFDVAGYELGLDPDAPAGQSSVAYWQVADIEAVSQRLLTMGATWHSPVQDVGEGIRTATLQDPFGNFVGLIQL